MRYSVIAIEREYASGGLEIGEKLAERLGVKCYGQEVLKQAADNLCLPAEQLARIEESITGDFMYGVAALASVTTGSNADFLSLEQKLAFAEADVIKNLSYSPCVIVGRGGCALLKDNAGALKVFIHANTGTRLERAVNTYKIDPKNVEAVLRYQDKRRSAYFKVTTQTEWKNADIYHVFLNSGMLGIEGSVEFLYNAIV